MQSSGTSTQPELVHIPIPEENSCSSFRNTAALAGSKPDFEVFRTETRGAVINGGTRWCSPPWYLSQAENEARGGARMDALCSASIRNIDLRPRWSKAWGDCGTN